MRDAFIEKKEEVERVSDFRYIRFKPSHVWIYRFKKDEVPGSREEMNGKNIEHKRMHIASFIYGMEV